MKYVISLGGSIIVPEDIDVLFVKKFVDLIGAELKKGNTFFIVTGGGATARKYIRALRNFDGRIPNEDLDWLGISATKMNAQLILSAFKGKARKHIIIDPSEKKSDLKKINLVSGWKPGWSTDFVAVKIAETYGIKTVLIP